MQKFKPGETVMVEGHVRSYTDGVYSVEIEHASTLVSEENIYSQPINQWISVNDRLPEKSREYIVSVGTGWFQYSTVMPYSKKYNLWNARDYDTKRGAKRCAIHKVTHWMLLPEPPEFQKAPIS